MSVICLKLSDTQYCKQVGEIDQAELGPDADLTALILMMK